MLPEGQQESAGSAQDSASAAQQGELAELRLLVRQQAQQAEEQRAEEQRAEAQAVQERLMEQLRASPAHSPTAPCVGLFSQ